MICKNCSAEVEEEAAYCRDCGFRLTAESRTPSLGQRLLMR
jgi:DNA-directed RNA polymerase subunit RPC12/RpoP